MVASSLSFGGRVLGGTHGGGLMIKVRRDGMISFVQSMMEGKMAPLSSQDWGGRKRKRKGKKRQVRASASCRKVEGRRAPAVDFNSSAKWKNEK